MKTFRLGSETITFSHHAFLFAKESSSHHHRREAEEREKDDENGDDFFCPARTGCNSSGRVWIRSVLRDNFYERLLEEE
jgi:hypothetical protein